MNIQCESLSHDAVLLTGDCRNILRQIPDGCIDSVVTDPPYPEIDREYGRLSSSEWFSLMRCIIPEIRRVLKPKGSAAFVLQPNSEYVGCMRTWLWKFMAWIGEEWNIVQDAYWWNHASMPTVHTHRTNGLMRPSVKTIVWCGRPNCYRNQDAVLWAQSDANAAANREDRALRTSPSGFDKRIGRMCGVSDERGGVTPFNLLPIANTNSTVSGGARGHGAATPMELCKWWVRYITPPGGTVLDPFAGSGTVGEAATNQGRRCYLIESHIPYTDIIRKRFADSNL